MEKRLKKTPAHTLCWTTSCLKLALAVILFLPGFVATGYIPQHYQTIEPILALQPRAIEKPRTRELVKVFSIVEANRPDIREREAWELSEVILKESSKYKLDPILILAVIDVESKFQFGAISPAGARGIMQIMPATGKFLVRSVRGLAEEIKADQFTPELLDDPIVNIKLGTYYLLDLRQCVQNVSKALIAYNLGPTELRTRMENQIDYTDEYANAVLAAQQKFKKIKLPTF
jgi:soluble lytic murein transglycosylase-like protein